MACSATTSHPNKTGRKLFPPKQQLTVTHKLPVFPDFMTELKRSWVPPKVPLSLPFTQFLYLEDIEPADLANIPPVDETLASHLTPKPNAFASRPTLISKQCRFSPSQLEKMYREQEQCCRLTRWKGCRKCTTRFWLRKIMRDY